MTEESGIGSWRGQTFFFCTVSRMSSGVQSVSYAVVSGLFPLPPDARGVKLNHSHLVPRFKDENTYC
jgi:hypothetical protein